MNKLSKIFLVIIILLVIALGFTAYGCYYFYNAWQFTGNMLIEAVNDLEKYEPIDNIDFSDTLE